MNLGIEYLTRNSALNDLLETPSTLFLNNRSTQQGRIVCLGESLTDANSYCVKIYDLVNTDLDRSHLSIGSALPTAVEIQIAKTDVFFHQDLIASEWSPLRYVEEPIYVSRNYINHPMESIGYIQPLNDCLNSRAHQSYKSDWLWVHFFRFAFGGRLPIEQLLFGNRQELIKIDQDYVESHYKDHWVNWSLWKNLFLFKERVAPELIFAKAFANISVSWT